jgi:hypothetical protein
MKFLAMTISLVVFGLCSTAFGYWESIGPEGGSVSFIFQSYTDSNLFYAVYGGKTESEFLKSTDQGANWSVTGSLSNSFGAMEIGLTGTLYGSTNGIIYRSTNEGLTWTPSTVTGFYAWDFDIHPTNPDILYAAGYRLSGSNYFFSMATTTNGGATWTVNDVTAAYQGYGKCIAVSPSSPGTIYFGGSLKSPAEPKLFRSTDGGSSWTELTYSGWNSDYYMNALAVHPTNPNTVCAATRYNIYRSTNGGVGWTKTGSGRDNSYEMAWSVDDTSVIFASATDVVHRSLNGGASWTEHASGLAPGTHQSIAADWSNSANLYTVSYLGVYRSQNTASSWFSSNGGILTADALCFCPVDCSPWTLYVSVGTFGLYRSTDNGATLEFLDTPLDCGDVCAIGTPTGNPNRVIALEGVG